MRAYSLAIECVLLVIGVILLAVTLDPTISGDGNARYDVVSAIVEGRALPSIKYSMVQPVFALPLASLAVLSGMPPSSFVAYFNFAVFLLASIALLILLRAEVPTIWIVRTILLLLSASMIPFHLQHFYGEVFSAVLIVVGVLLRNRSAWACTVLTALGAMNTPAFVIPLLLAGAVLGAKERNWSVLAGALVGGLLVVGEHHFKFGVGDSPYLSGGEKGVATVLPYSGLPGFSYPIFFGIISILFSFGKGIVFYIPGLLLLLSSKIRAALRLNNASGVALAVFVVATILIYAKWWAWYGGDFWGPRFFLIFCFPAAIALMAAVAIPHSTWGSKLATMAILMLSTWVAVDGYVFAQSHLELCFQNDYALEFLCWYVPEFSALWRPFVTQEIWEVFSRARGSFALWQIAVSVYFAALILLPATQSNSVSAASSSQH